LWRATLPNKKTIKEQERDLKREIDRKNAEEPYKFTKKDILAMIIAAFQIIFPIVVLGAIVFGLFILFFTKVFLK
jgi:uncharacterized ion transporter superfamily protein YfcC